MYSDSENLLFIFIISVSNPGISVLPSEGKGKIWGKVGPNLGEVHFT